MGPTLKFFICPKLCYSCHDSGLVMQNERFTKERPRKSQFQEKNTHFMKKEKQ